MRGCRFTKQHRPVKKNVTNIAIQLFAMAYVLLCVVSYMTGPTSAYFNDAAAMNGNLSAAEDFGTDSKQEDDQAHDSSDHDADKQTQESSTGQDKGQKSPDQKSDQQSSPEGVSKDDPDRKTPSKESGSEATPEPEENADRKLESSTSYPTSHNEDGEAEDTAADVTEQP